MQTEYEVDWLVAGSGAAGMTGAVVAHQLGGAVLVVEKEPRYGGTTCKSGGVIWIPGNHRQAEFGIGDSAEEGWQYLKGLIGESVSEPRLRAYAQRASEMLAFMMAHSHVDYSPLPTYMDYYEEVDGYKSGGRSMDPGFFSLRRLGDEADFIRDDFHGLLKFNVTVPEGRCLGDMNAAAYWLGFRLLLRYWLDLPSRLRGKTDQRATLGPALVARLRRSLLDRDIPLWLNTPIRELLVEGDRVTGAIVERDGIPCRITARKGVLLATGGFSKNTAMRQQYQQAPIGAEWTAAATGATGDGITLGLSLGADLDFMGSAWWSPTYRMPDGRVLALIAGKAYPGSVLINRQGLRFTNEAQPYEDVVKDQYASELRGEGAIPCYLLFDATYRQNYPVGHIKPGKFTSDASLPEELFSSGLLTRADTLPALAEALGIDAVALEATINRFNANARVGKDPDFGRGDSEHDRYYADPKIQPNPCLGPLETGPYYAMRCEAGDLDTKGGLLCDEFGRVLHESGKEITGLYAAGNTSAAVMGDTYPGAGATIGSAMTFAYIAARHAFGHDGVSNE
ncbi:FAD-binding protein [Kineobactrum sediminis]|uniref:FAD-binding protein n=1 Tax=Kineobactrum sediminis TaxID=1905677 RepID=UPI0013901F0D|nr:FAD-binding protein [Kineobactrum sediminis]